MDRVADIRDSNQRGRKMVRDDIIIKTVDFMMEIGSIIKCKDTGNYILQVVSFHTKGIGQLISFQGMAESLMTESRNLKEASMLKTSRF